MGPHRVTFVLAAFVVTVVSFSGFLESPQDDPEDRPEDGTEDGAETAGPFVVEYEIVDPGEQESRTANPGAHCASASKQDGTLRLGLWPGEDRGEGPWLAVFPRIPDHWQTTHAGESFKSDLPVHLDPEVEDDATFLGVVDWVPEEHDPGNGSIRLNGVPVSFPHEWEVTGEDGWRANATLYEWEGGVEFEQYEGRCL